MDSKAEASFPAPAAPAAKEEKGNITRLDPDDLESLKAWLSSPEAPANEEPPASAPPVAGTEQKPDATPEEAADAKSGADPEAGAEAHSQDENAEPEPKGGAEDDAEETGDNEPEPEAGTPVNRKKLLKRIDTLTARAKTAEEDLAEAREKLEELHAKVSAIESGPPAGSAPGANRFAAIHDERKLDDEAVKARSLKRWCEDNPDGATVDGKEFTAEDIRQFRRAAEDAIEIDLPQRREFLRQFRQLHAQALDEFPWLKDRKSEEYALAEQWRKDPAIAGRPTQDYIIAALIEGAKVIKERREAAARPKPPVKPAPKPASRQPAAPAAAPAKVDAARNSYEQARARVFKSGGSDEALTEFLKNF